MEGKSRAEISGDLGSIQGLFNVGVNLKSIKMTEPLELKLLDRFVDTYLQKQKTPPCKGTTKGLQISETASNYGQLLMLAKALAKADHYDNVIFELLFKELKHIMMFNSTNAAFSKVAGGGGGSKGHKVLRNELAHINIYLKYDKHSYKTFE